MTQKWREGQKKLTHSFHVLLLSLSDLRPVPDNQEVYIWATGFTSVIVDVLERVSPITTAAAGGAPPGLEDSPDVDALRFHFMEIVNKEDVSRTWTIEQLGPEEGMNDHFP